MTTTHLLTHYPAAVKWLRAQGFTGIKPVTHLGLADVQPGDKVVGALPAHLVAAVSERGGRYFHLTINVPPQFCDLDLSAEVLQRFGARLDEHVVCMNSPTQPLLDPVNP